MAEEVSDMGDLQKYQRYNRVRDKENEYEDTRKLKMFRDISKSQDHVDKSK